MKILFSLSKKHWDATTQTMKIPHSTGTMCRLFWEAIKDMGDILIIDSEDTSVKGYKFDLLVGLPRNFKFLTDNNDIRVSTCFPNICEGNDLKARLLTEAHRLGCKLRDAYAPTSYYHADHLFVIGGKHNVEGFLNAGIPASKITPLYYKPGISEFKFRPKNKKTIFLHAATTLGLRKGFWHVVEEFKKTNIDAGLWIMGQVQKEHFWYEYAQEARKDPRIKIIGWIENTDPKYKEILYKSDFIVFPSLGEGQPGTVSEAMEAGCLPIISKTAGIEDTPFPFWKFGEDNTYLFEKAHVMNEMDWDFFQRDLNKLFQTKYDNEEFIAVVKSKLKELLND